MFGGQHVFWWIRSVCVCVFFPTFEWQLLCGSQCLIIMANAVSKDYCVWAGFKRNIKQNTWLWFGKKTNQLRFALHLRHQEAEQPLGRGRCFPGEEAEWAGKRQDGCNQDPVWSGRHHNQRQQQEQGIQERRNRAGEFSTPLLPCAD